jgi:hypothetical protein
MEGNTMSDSDYENCIFHSLESDSRASEIGTKLDALNARVTAQLKSVRGFSSFYLYAASKSCYVASVVLERETDVKRFERDGELRKLTEYVSAELERAGFRKKDETTLRFYLDSAENTNSKRSRKTIPTDEDFARAEALDRERSRNLDDVCEAARRRFEKVCAFHDIYILPQQDVTFRAYVFFDEDKDIEVCRRSGVVHDIIDFVYAELERAGRGKRGDITVAFEFDSDENVTVNYEGDYFLRLR